MCMTCLYTAGTFHKYGRNHSLDNKVKLLEGISAYAEHVTNYFAVFSEMSGQLF